MSSTEVQRQNEFCFSSKSPWGFMWSEVSSLIYVQLIQSLKSHYCLICTIKYELKVHRVGLLWSLSVCLIMMERVKVIIIKRVLSHRHCPQNWSLLLTRQSTNWLGDLEHGLTSFSLSKQWGGSTRAGNSTNYHSNMSWVFTLDY